MTSIFIRTQQRIAPNNYNDSIFMNTNRVSRCVWVWVSAVISTAIQMQVSLGFSEPTKPSMENIVHVLLTSLPSENLCNSTTPLFGSGSRLPVSSLFFSSPRVYAVFCLSFCVFVPPTCEYCALPPRVWSSLQVFMLEKQPRGSGLFGVIFFILMKSNVEILGEFFFKTDFRVLSYRLTMALNPNTGKLSQ